MHGTWCHQEWYKLAFFSRATGKAMRPGGMLWMDDDREDEMKDDMVMLMLLLARQSGEKEDEIEELEQAQAGLQAQVQTLTTQNRALQQRALALADAKNAALEQRLARIERAVDEGRTVGGNKRQRVPSGQRDAATSTAAAGSVRQRVAPAIARRLRPAT
jgi:hypothetical protein